ncbi:MAG TPA: dockerin type I domain-containing protein [Thermoguttaceae bacterium]|nr:dockerin type I domain-containing protein [Thermoguttaceae bacterium]
MSLGLVTWACLHGALCAATVVWNFDENNLLSSAACDATAVMSYFDADPGVTQTVQKATTFGVTGRVGAPSNMADGEARYLRHGTLPNYGHGGYAIDHTGFHATTADGRMQTWTMVMDIYVPSTVDPTTSYNGMFNSDTTLSNGAEWYLGPYGTLGYGSLGTTALHAWNYSQWHRVGLVYDRPGHRASYWIDGAKVLETTNVADDRYLLWASGHAGADLIYQGDRSVDSPPNNYTSTMYTSSLSLADFAYSDATMQALGGPTVAGIPIVNEPVRLGALSEFNSPAQLDLTGNFRYAIDMGSATPWFVSGLQFQAGQSGITGYAADGFAPAQGNRPEFGDSPSLYCLESVLETAAWHEVTAQKPNGEITLDVTVGKRYKLQLLFWKAFGARWFDVSVEGRLVLDEFNPSSNSEEEAFLYTYEFTAADNEVNILFAPGDPSCETRHPVLNALTLEMINQIPGDIDGDNVVDAEDAAVVASHWGASDAGWEDGDFNADGLVNALDASILAANWGDHRAESAPCGVPEPLGFVLALEMIAAFGLRRRRA